MIMNIKNVFRSVIFFAFMPFHKIIIIFGIINTFILLWILHEYDVYNNWNVPRQMNNDVFNSPEFLSLNQTTNLHVYIVEEHHEVIPYWFTAAKSFNNEKAVLIHIDAHSDMDYPELVDEFPIGHFPRSNNEMQTLMQSNDEFIQSAIIANLIQTVYIIYPYWTFNGSYAYTSSLGITTINNTKQVCMCLDINNNEEDDVNCKTRNQNDTLNDLLLSFKQCPKTWLYHYIELNSLTASNILHYSKYWSFNKTLFKNGTDSTFNPNKQTNDHHHPHPHHLPLILDIDEDFFGVHIVTNTLFKSGLNYDFIQSINLIISSIFCPISSYINENVIDQIFHWLIQQIYFHIHYNKNNQKSIIDHYRLDILIKKINKTLQLTDILCNHYQLYIIKLNQLFINYTITYDQMKIISHIGVCYTYSILTYQYIPEIHLCLGHNLPNTTLIDEYLPTSKDLLKLAIQFTQILLSIPYLPNIITIARSSRDGYTPRWLQYHIETMILNIIKTVFNLTENSIIFTKHLAGDKYYGWYERFTRINDNL